MQKIDYSDFANFFQTTIAPVIQPYETERLDILKITKHNLIILFIMMEVMKVFPNLSY